jgi:hypothetical protein
MRAPGPAWRTPVRWAAVLAPGVLALLFLAGCSSLRVGFSIPVGPAGVGISVGGDGSVGAGVGVSVGGASVGVGTSGRLPTPSPAEESK